MTSFQRQFILSLLAFSLFAIGMNGYANQEIDVQFSGFGSLFVTNNSESDLGYYREFTNPPQEKSWTLSTDSNLGVQVDTYFDDSLSATIQFVGKDLLENNLDNALRWANVKYSTPDFNVRFGRAALDIHMLSEYRDVGFAYLWVRPITEFYTPILFNHVDGADISFFHQLDSGTIQFKLFSGKTKTANLQSSNEVSVGNGSLYGTTILYESQTWKLRAATVKGKVTKVASSIISQTLSGLRGINSQYSALWPNISEIIDRVDPSDGEVDYYSLGASYNTDAIQIQSEISYLSYVNWEIIPATYSAYISIAKPLNKFTPYITASRIKNKDEAYQLPTPLSVAPAQIQEFHKLLQHEFDMGLSDQKTLSIGIRWDIRDDVSLKAQWDHTKIKDQKSALWHNTTYPNIPETVDTFSIGLNFIF